MRDRTVIALAILYAVMRAAKERIEWGSGWHWPVPDLIVPMRGRANAEEVSGTARWPATISQEYREADHKGVDIMYRRSNTADLLLWPSLSKWFAPDDTPILAAKDGYVWSVDDSPVGKIVVLDHGKPWATRYIHLADVSVKRGDVVQAGQRIGTMGANPNNDPARGVVDPAKVVHLHFECMYNSNVSNVDPSTEMAGWERSTWTP